jgi:surface polysaccharide O-acyltransferase-like enzyme
MPPIRYIELRRDGVVHGGFIDFLPSFFTRMDRFTWSHLWFLAYLFAFTVLYRPLFERLQRLRAEVSIPSAALVYAPIVPLALVQLTLRGRWPGYQNLYDDWANFTYYSLFFIGGYLLGRWPSVERAVHRERRRAALVALAALALMVPGFAQARLPRFGLTAEWLGGQTLSAIAGYCTVIALLGYAAKYLRFSNRALAYVRDSQMPVYVLHQAAVVAVAALVIQLRMPIAPKYALVLAGATATTLAAYQLVVRPRARLRTLLGTKNPPPVTARTVTAPASGRGWGARARARRWVASRLPLGRPSAG